MKPSKETLLTTLQSRFGLKEFRPGQLEAIECLFEQKRLLCIQPTGFGKSLLYQLPASLLDGLTVVISPLLALMRDQSQQLNSRFNLPTASINSDQSEEENNLARKAASDGSIKILFIAPEQLDNIERFNFILNLPIDLLVVDEAHCISQWGHDFRPSYRQIIQIVQALQEKNSDSYVLGLTATANEKTADDIRQQFETRGCPMTEIRAPLDRANIALSVILANGLAEKIVIVQNLLTQLDGCGLIYCSTRENTELLSEYLQRSHNDVTYYHAGLAPDVKRDSQRNFISNRYKVIVATNALGMGIDKSDLRFIIHFDVPGSITAYYQEVGRCGRDGLPAQGILLFDQADKKIQEYFINSAQPNVDAFNRVLTEIKTAQDPPGLVTIKQLTGLHPTMVTVVVAELVEQNFVTKKAIGKKQVYVAADNSNTPNLERYKIQHEVKMRELNAMLSYAEQKQSCYMNLLRQALGDSEASDCGRCAQCAPQDVTTSTLEQTCVSAINDWLQNRVALIAPIRTNSISAGISVLDGKLHSPMFVEFMRNRANSNDDKNRVNEALLKLIIDAAHELHRKHQFTSILALPSRTWSTRKWIAQKIAQSLNIAVQHDYLHWQREPEKRQGELLNNDQRRANVDKKMTCSAPTKLPTGPLLLLDDYIGSGATMREAARTLRKQACFTDVIVPFTIAQIKWRLGRSGMI